MYVILPYLYLGYAKDITESTFKKDTVDLKISLCIRYIRKWSPMTKKKLHYLMNQERKLAGVNCSQGKGCWGFIFLNSSTSSGFGGDTGYLCGW